MPNTHHIAFRSNRVRDIVEQMRHELLPLYGPGETAALTERLFEAFLGWDRVRLPSTKATCCGSTGRCTT